MEDRPIGAERLKCKIKLDINYGILSKSKRKQDVEMYYRESDIFELIDNAPTMEAAKQGKWIKDRSRDMLRCSACEDFYVDLWLYWYNFCPNCGARMDGE